MGKLIATIIVVTICGICAAPADADTITWTGNGDSNNNGSWSDPNNWDLARVPGEGDMVILPSVTGNGNSGDNIRTITIPAGAAVVVAELRMTQESASYYSVLDFQDDLSLTDLTLLPPYVFGTGAKNNRLNLNSHALTIEQGAMPVLAGTGEVVKNGTETVIWPQDCFSFGGSVSINGGMIDLYSSHLGDGAAFTVGEGARLRLYSLPSLNPALIGLGGEIGIGGNRSHPCPIFLATDSLISVGGDHAFLSGEISGPGGFTKTNTGALTLSAHCTYAGRTIVSEGELEVAGSLGGDVTVKNGATLVAIPDQIGGAVTVEPGGTWESNPLWSGASSAPASPNNDGLWSDPANWNSGQVPESTDRVALQPVAGPGNSGDSNRTVTLDQATQISELRMMQGSEEYNNILVLNADLTVGKLQSIGGRDHVIVDVNGQTLTVEEGTPPMFAGEGRLIKNGTEPLDCVHNSPSFVGTVTINAGDLWLFPASIPNCTMLTVNEGGCAMVLPAYVDSLSVPLTLNGAGPGGYGALKFFPPCPEQTFPITLASDAAIYSALNTTLAGNIDGPAGLTLKGGGFVLAGNNTYAGDTTVDSYSLQINSFVPGDVIVRSGAILRAAPHQIGGDVILEGGTWEQTSTWTGGADLPEDPNNDGNWSDALNWSPPSIPVESDLVIIPPVTGIGNSGDNVRTITVDTETAIFQLQMAHDSEAFDSVLALEADLSVERLEFMPFLSTYPESNTIELGGHTLTVNWGQWLPALSGDGAVIKNGGANLYSRAASPSFTGSITLNAGGVGLYDHFPNCSALTVNGGATLSLYADDFLPPVVVLNGGSVFLRATFEHTAAITLQSDSIIDARYDYVVATLSGEITGSGALIKEGEGRLILCDISNYTGTIIVNEGTVQIRDAGGGNVNVNAGATFSGAGGVGGSLVLNDASSLEPGASPGGVSAGYATMGATTYNCEINDPDGEPGVGYDLLDVAQRLTIAATPESPATINLISLTPDNVPGPLANFDKTQPYEWTVARADTIVGFDPAAFVIDVTEFQNDLYAKKFYVVERDGEIRLRLRPQLAGDATGDCAVTVLDMIFVRNRLYQDAATEDNWLADHTGDGAIDVLDMIFVRNHLNTICDPP